MVQTDNRSMIETSNQTEVFSYRGQLPNINVWFIVAHNTISGIIREVCKGIVAVYAGDVINTTTEPEQWKL